MPRVNWTLFGFVALTVLLFRSSSHLATAYGIAVTTTMVITSAMTFFVVRRLWHWSLPATLMPIVPLMAIEIVFLAANLLKVLDGGWLPLILVLSSSSRS